MKNKTLSKKKIEVINARNGEISYEFKEKDIKQFIRKLNNFIEDKKIMKRSMQITIIRFIPFEWEEFLKENLGDLE